jgi:SOS-response transcriptional repressor LexA
MSMNRGSVNPTTRQRQVLQAIRDYTAANGYPPTVRELCARLGISSNNAIADHVAALRRKGMLRPAPGVKTARSLVLTEAAHVELRDGLGAARRLTAAAQQAKALSKELRKAQKAVAAKFAGGTDG